MEMAGHDGEFCRILTRGGSEARCDPHECFVVRAGQMRLRIKTGEGDPHPWSPDCPGRLFRLCGFPFVRMAVKNVVC